MLNISTQSFFSPVDEKHPTDNVTSTSLLKVLPQREEQTNHILFYFTERNNMFGDDSRLSHILKRITKESERERRLTASQQLEEFLNNPDNYQVTNCLQKLSLMYHY